ncbi:MAG: hypothetical protein WAK01_06995 [Methylocystis sp.]
MTLLIPPRLWSRRPDGALSWAAVPLAGYFVQKVSAQVAWIRL